MIELNNLNIKALEEAIILIKSELKPVVFWDTCSIIDIIRLPNPSRNHSQDLVDKVIEIKNAIVNKKIYSLSSERCIKEIDDNMKKEIENYKKEIQKLSKEVNKIHHIINKTGFTSDSLANIDLNSYSLEIFFCDLAQAILDNTIFIKEKTLFLNNADKRYIDNITPAKKKGEFKDCYIWETSLQTRIASNDTSYPWFFASSNTSDYADEKPNQESFALDIISEVSDCKITYSKDFNILRKQLFDAGAL